MTVYTTDLSSTEIDRWITRARLAPYVHVAGSDEKDLAARLYVWNARLASACLETIHHVEVLVRNAIDHQLATSQPPDSLRSWIVDPDVLKPGELRAVHLPASCVPPQLRTAQRRCRSADRVSQMRNDIAHHHSLLDVPVEARYRDLLDLAAAVDPAAAAWIEGISRVADVLAEAPPGP